MRAAVPIVAPRSGNTARNKQNKRNKKLKQENKETKKIKAKLKLEGGKKRPLQKKNDFGEYGGFRCFVRGALGT